MVLIDGLLAAHITRGGKTMTTFFDHFPDGVGDPLPLVVHALDDAVKRGRMSPLSVEKLNGGAAFGLREVGATVTHKGARIGGKVHAAPKRRGRSVAEALEEMGELDPRLPAANEDEVLSFDD